MQLATGMTLVGRCASKVTLTGTIDQQGIPTTLYIVGGETTLRGLTIWSAGVAVLATSTAKVTMEDLVLQENQGGAVIAAGPDAVVSGTRVLIRDTLGLQWPDTRGVNAQQGATISLHQSTILRVRGVGARATGVGSSVSLTDCAINTIIPTESLAGQGLAVVGGAHVDATDTTITVAFSQGAMALDTGSELVLERVVVDGVIAPSPDISPAGVIGAGSADVLIEQCLVSGTIENEGFGAGVAAVSGADVTVLGSELRENFASGVTSAGPGATLTLDASFVRDTVHVPDLGVGESLAGHGALAQLGGQLKVKGSVLAGNNSSAIVADGLQVQLEVAETLVRDTLKPGSGPYLVGEGISLRHGASALVSDSVMTGNRSANISVREGSSASLDGVLLTDGVDEPTWLIAGIGLLVDGGSTVDASGLAAFDHIGAAVIASDPGSTLTLARAVIADTEPGPDGTAGQGLRAQVEAQITAEDVVVTGSHHSGVASSSGGAAVTVERLEVADTAPDEDGEAGSGLTCFDGELHVTGAIVDASRVYGAFNDGGDLTLEQVLVRGTQSSAATGLAFGVLTSGGGTMALTDCATIGNTGVGVLADGDVAGGAVVIEHVLSTDTTPFTTAAGSGGVGFVIQGDYASAIIRDSAALGNRAAGVFLLDTAADVQRTLVQGSIGGDLTSSVVGVGDGLFAVRSEVALESVRATGNTRAGFLFVDSGGSMSGCLATDNELGLATQGAPTVTWGEDTLLTRNLTNEVIDGAFETPSESLAVPPPPVDPDPVGD